jgi:hypothetical protein
LTVKAKGAEAVATGAPVESPLVVVAIAGEPSSLLPEVGLQELPKMNNSGRLKAQKNEKNLNDFMHSFSLFQRENESLDRAT